MSTPQEAIPQLVAAAVTELLQQDPHTLTRLFEYRTQCLRKTADHPYATVSGTALCPTLGLLGVIQAITGKLCEAFQQPYQQVVLEYDGDRPNAPVVKYLRATTRDPQAKSS